MYDERIDEIMEKDPSKRWLKQIADTGIIVISPNVEKYKKDPNQIVLSGYLGKKTISKQFVIDMITHDDTFDKVRQVYENDLFNIVTLFVNEKGEFIEQYNFTKMVIIDLLKKIDIHEFPSIADRYDQIMDFVSYEKHKESTKNDYYKIIIDGKKYKIPVILIYQFMDMDNETFNKLIANEKSFNAIPLSHFLYAVNQYFVDKKIIDNYDVDEELKNRLKEITSSEKVDVQTLNTYRATDDSLLEKIHVNDELKDSILSGISPEFSDVEKAIYIYIKMCKLLTYDEEFYVVNQKGPLSKKHKTIENISNISLSNNKVVCYEFNAVYSYLLHKLGINYKNFVSTSDIDGEQHEREFFDECDAYSDGHTFLKFRCGKHLVKADSVTSILQGDLMQAKLNQPLRGLICENINENSKKEFFETVSRVYRYIVEREPKVTQNEAQKHETFEDIVSQFVDMSDGLKPVDIKEKVDILIKKVNSTKMIGVDAYSYLLQLRRILFSPQEQQDNIKISIIRNSSEDSARALSVISIRLPDKNGKMTINRYIFKPGIELIPITEEDLQKNFDDKTMGYIGSDDPKIPGIKK